MSSQIFQMSQQYEEYLMDESRFCGYADSISFPETEEELVDILKVLAQSDTSVTVQGGKTGIVGGAVPQGGHILNLSHMNRILESCICEDGIGQITVQPGINLIELRKEIASRFRKERLFWAPDPTETSASVGGIVASGAQGPCRLLYGNIGQHIEKLRLSNSDGAIREIAGSQLTDVIGLEGITGIITEVTLKLIKKPEEMWGIAFFFDNKTEAGAFIDQLREEIPETEGAAIASVEYIDRCCINLIEQRKSSMTKIRELPDIRENVEAMVCIEIHGSEEGIEEIAEVLMESAMECGSDPDEAWAVSGETDTEKLHAFRHSAAETANLFIEEKRREDERITKLGTDLVFEDRSFSDMLAEYEEMLKENGLRGCIFGHAMENHLHVNILPDNYEEYEKGTEMIYRLALEADNCQGRIIGEHGIGKLRKKIVGDAVSDEYIRKCRALKEEMDKGCRVNCGNIFDW